jgi:hypothetical protein
MRGAAGPVRKEEDDGGRVGWTDYPSAVIFISSLEIHGKSSPFTTKWKWQGRSGHPRVSAPGAAASTTHGKQGNRAEFSHPRAGRAVKRGQQPERVSVRSHNASGLVIISLSWHRVV